MPHVFQFVSFSFFICPSCCLNFVFCAVVQVRSENQSFFSSVFVLSVFSSSSFPCCSLWVSLSYCKRYSLAAWQALEMDLIYMFLPSTVSIVCQLFTNVIAYYTNVYFFKQILFDNTSSVTTLLDRRRGQIIL